MTEYKNVQGTQPTVPSLEINVDTVYIRTNIQDIRTEEMPVLWQYDEIQMTIEEYLKQAVPENQDIADESMAELSMAFAEYQAQTDMAIAELSSLIATGGSLNV